MSNGRLVKLPPDSIPEGISVPEGPSVTVLLPNNAYLLGTKGDSDNSSGFSFTRWIYGHPNEKSEIFLYDDEDRVKLPSDETGRTEYLSSKVIKEIKDELFLQIEPPGNHISTVMILRTFMKNNPAFNLSSIFQEEKPFMKILEKDLILKKAYWALRFALSRGELEAIARLKAWLKAGPEVFSNENENENEKANKFVNKIWFSILESPEEEALKEMEEFGFPREDILRMPEQGVSPLLLYSRKAGYFILARFGRKDGSENYNNNTAFFIWVYLNPALWDELKNRRNISVHEIILSLWGNYDAEMALKERARYKKI